MIYIPFTIKKMVNNKDFFWFDDYFIILLKRKWLFQGYA
jgi:hypothetical protein